MRNTTGEARTNWKVMFSYGPTHMDEQVLADQQERTYTDAGYRQEDLAGW